MAPGSFMYVALFLVWLKEELMYPGTVTWGKPAQQFMRKCWHLVPKMIRVRFYCIMSELGGYLYPSNNVLARRLPFGLYMKYCARSQRNEVVALRLVEEHTTAAAPLWVDDYEEDGNTTLIMTQYRGKHWIEFFTDFLIKSVSSSPKT
ncbi:hypothetical protein BDV33DRAFT_209219 [Aspergillus novoparasiticus]|uniref:Uncharacterized protein n=1 Tax=Aspergillus novoparasiticus TaxID=986946 RepID=A0A5N6EAA6_9EURO|nr:hypothetical protein BDV33DRAFT_209219 [Aspergillus novoparasiticus]